MINIHGPLLRQEWGEDEDGGNDDGQDEIGGRGDGGGEDHSS